VEALQTESARPRVLVVLTRGERGGAQVHVRDLLLGLRDRFEFLLVLGEPGFLMPELLEAGIPVEHLPSLVRELSPRLDRRALSALRARIRSFQPDLVHTHSSKAGILGRLAARAEGVTSVHTAHSWSFSDGVGARRKALAVPLEAAVARVTPAFIVVSEADREVALRWRVARSDQLHVVHNGVPDDAAAAQPRGAGPPRLIMVARMAAPKDHALLLRALAGLSQPFELELVGDGPDEDLLRGLCQELGLSDRVRFSGRCSDVPRRLAEAQLFLLISRQEGFPISILEAMRAGLPVLASDVGGVSEAVAQDQTGLLVQRGDLGGLQRALSRLIEQPGLRVRLGQEGRARFLRDFTVARCLDGTREVYARLGVR
jgi:glycosyltransferase involved in cell wall biosynthesis